MFGPFMHKYGREFTLNSILHGSFIISIKYSTICYSEFNILGISCLPGSVGQSYTGVNNRILDPDSNGIGEIATKSRNVVL